ncbi:MULTISPECIES: RNA polymerase sigma factor [unclassified Sphingobacterium]|uniref:RNA polymerase sigma factor n=1 Tax=unclassified Sphingobacterium TaxID=2609468 RepID=UPI0020C28D81|nr:MULTISPECIES: RNA polymerase sigma-70 factor [unclassified Sphingobacterium]
MSIENETEILCSVADGSEKSFLLIYNKYREGVCNFVLKYVKSKELAEDISQEIFLKIWEKRENLRSVENFKNYIITISKNHTLNQLRKISNTTIAFQYLMKSISIQDTSTNDELQLKEYHCFIRKEFEKLPAKSQQIYNLCKEQELTYDEVAKVMGFSRHAVKKHMTQTLKVLRTTAKKRLDIHLCILFEIIFLLT